MFDQSLQVSHAHPALNFLNQDDQEPKFSPGENKSLVSEFHKSELMPWQWNHPKS